MKQLTINGNNFFDEESFYDEIDRVFTHNLDWKTGHNLDAFNDLLRGGFGVFDYEENIKLIWLNSKKSKIDLNTKEYDKNLFEIIIEIIKRHEHIELVLT